MSSDHENGISLLWKLNLVAVGERQRPFLVSDSNLLCFVYAIWWHAL